MQQHLTFPQKWRHHCEPLPSKHWGRHRHHQKVHHLVMAKSKIATMAIYKPPPKRTVYQCVMLVSKTEQITSNLARHLKQVLIELWVACRLELLNLTFSQVLQSLQMSIIVTTCNIWVLLATWGQQRQVVNTTLTYTIITWWHWSKRTLSWLITEFITMSKANHGVIIATLKKKECALL